MLLLTVVSISTVGQTADTPLYDVDSALNVTLSAPHKAIYRARKDPQRPSFEGTWEYTNDAGETVQLSVGVRPRGNFRRENCRHIPLQINFKKGQVKKTLFKGQNKIKLVGPCSPGARAREWLMLEYLSYRALEKITPLHFRTRLLNLTYAEAGSSKSRTDFAFIIESDGDTAKRLGLDLEREDVAMSRLNPEHSALVEVFQYFIGNNDYSTSRAATPDRTCCHNMRLLVDRQADEGFLPVPYDFDHAGIVDPSYARASKNVPGNSVRKRYFTGLCKKDEAIWNRTFERFNQQRQAIEQLFVDGTLKESSRESALKYINEFYQIINDEQRSRREIIDRCRG
ncbi:MAG: hypothetical protein AB8B96_12030 [Lysobacterales bacterium]